MQRAGTPISVNAGMLGTEAGMGMTSVEPRMFHNGMKEIVPGGAAKANVDAFQAGVEMAQKCLM